jgi:hypothetical protein
MPNYILGTCAILMNCATLLMVKRNNDVNRTIMDDMNKMIMDEIKKQSKQHMKSHEENMITTDKIKTMKNEEKEKERKINEAFEQKCLKGCLRNLNSMESCYKQCK